MITTNSLIHHFAQFLFYFLAVLSNIIVLRSTTLVVTESERVIATVGIELSFSIVVFVLTFLVDYEVLV